MTDEKQKNQIMFLHCKRLLNRAFKTTVITMTTIERIKIVLDCIGIANRIGNVLLFAKYTAVSSCVGNINSKSSVIRTGCFLSNTLMCVIPFWFLNLGANISLMKSIQNNRVSSMVASVLYTLSP